MRRFKFSLVSVALLALIGVVGLFFVRLILHRPTEIVLPSTEAIESENVIEDADQEVLRRVEVKEDTVQLIIAQLKRPQSYRRTLRLERYWGADGQGSTTAEVRVAGGWMQVDATDEREQQRHVISGDGRVWIWYGSGGRVYTGASVFSADEEQGIPSYEDILLLETASIAAADYRMFEDAPCIYVETAADASGCYDRYWIDSEHGLLSSAERWQGERVVYRMDSSALDQESDNSQPFELPNGETLFTPGENTGAA